jgi:hypothetical protein
MILLVIACAVITVITNAEAAGPSASQLLSKTNTCTQISAGRFLTDFGRRAAIPVCGTNGAVYWKADMDIDCDGRRDVVCNENTDAAFHPATAFTTSVGAYPYASKTPYVVVPMRTNRWDYEEYNVRPLGIAAVIFNGKVKYAPVMDIGPPTIIGEGSYALASSLGINPNPTYGGVGTGVTYIVFTGTRAVKPEDNTAVTRLGESLADEWSNSNEGAELCGGVTTTNIGTAGDEAIPGARGPDVIEGLGGADQISGLGGNDVICGGTGNDTVQAGPDNDRALGEIGNDTVRGGDGSDQVNGGEGADQVFGDQLNDALTGGPGTDRCDGGTGTDTTNNTCETRISIP